METDCGFRNPKILPQEMYFRVPAYNVTTSGRPDSGIYSSKPQKTVSRLWGAWRTTPVQDYFWAVICKNHRFHYKGNIGYEHHMLLGETDAYASLPMLPEKIKVRCDSLRRGVLLQI